MLNTFFSKRCLLLSFLLVSFIFPSTTSAASRFDIPSLSASATEAFSWFSDYYDNYTSELANIFYDTKTSETPKINSTQPPSITTPTPPSNPPPPPPPPPGGGGVLLSPP